MTAHHDDVEGVSSAELVAAVPRYNPRLSYVLTRIPVLRELVTWNLALVLRRR